MTKELDAQTLLSPKTEEEKAFVKVLKGMDRLRVTVIAKKKKWLK